VLVVQVVLSETGGFGHVREQMIAGLKPQCDEDCSSQKLGCCISSPSKKYLTFRS
jgi:hypothetical protein